MQIIAGRHKGKKLFCPDSEFLRPTTSLIRGSIFNRCQHCIENANFLDLFSGCGAIGLEALSRGALQATFVESAKLNFSYIQKNVYKMQEESRSKILMMDAFQALKVLADQGRQFDIIFADPPYGKEGRFLSNQVLAFVEASTILKADGELFLEDDLDAANYAPELTRLKLKNSRSIGRTLIRHYVCV